MNYKKIFIILLMLISFTFISSCDLTNKDYTIPKQFREDAANEYALKENSKLGFEFNNSELAYVKSIEDEISDDLYNGVIKYYNTSAIIDVNAKKEGISYLEYLLGDNFKTSDLNQVVRYMENGINWPARIFIINNTYPLISKRSFHEIYDYWEGMDYKINISLIPEGIKKAAGTYLEFNNLGKMLTNIDEYVSDFYLDDGTTYVCSLLWDSFTNLKYNVYEGCRYLPSIDNPYFAFISPIDKTKDSYVIHPKTKVVADMAFGGCENVEAVEFLSEDTLVGLGKRSFYGCTNLKKINFPTSLDLIYSEIINDLPNIEKNEDDVAIYIGNNTNPKLMLYQITNKSIDSFTFDENTKIVCDHAFSNCKNLKKVEFNNITYIGSEIFNYSGVKEIVVGEKTKIINDYAFSISSIEKIEILAHNVMFNKNVFSSNLNELYFKGSISDYLKNTFNGELFGKKSTTSFFIDNNGKYELVDNIKINDNIPNFAFANLSTLNNVELLDDVETIGKNAFSSSSIKKIIINEKLKHSSIDAFYDCTKLTRCVYKGTSTTFSQLSFDNIYANPIFYAHNLYLIKDGREMVVESLVIDDTVDHINDYVFYNLNSVKKITIGKNVLTIGAYSFTDAKNLKEVYIIGEVKMIKASAFASNSGPNIYFYGSDNSKDFDESWNDYVGTITWNYN